MEWQGMIPEVGVEVVAGFVEMLPVPDFFDESGN
jgi:hypothetical protein